MIDVAALGPHTMEQNDFLDRKELYASLLRPHLAAPWVHGGQQKCILLDIPDPERVVSAPPISTVEYCLVSCRLNSVSDIKIHFRSSHKIKSTKIRSILIEYSI